MNDEKQPGRLYRVVNYGSVLDESIIDTRNPGLVVAQNVVYRPLKSVSKRPGTSGYGGAFNPVVANYGVISGVRWSRGFPSFLKQMIVQCNDALWVGNDAIGEWTQIGALGTGSSPAFYASASDPAQSNVTGTPKSDILIIAYGSGAPKKWDGANFTALSPSITNPFTGCLTWHSHAWFWGDPSNPDTLFASDLANPEGFTFTQTQTPPGYVIAPGDGDPFVTRCVDLGPVMAVMKGKSIQQMTGFDFYQGEYQFALQPWVAGCGTPAPHSVATMAINGTMVMLWWDGATFNLMGAADAGPTKIGLPIVNTAATAAMNSQTAIRAAAGSFVVATVSGFTTFTNVYLCAIDSGSGYADTILMFDYDATQEAGKPAWSVLKGLNIGCFIPWIADGDPSQLYFGDAVAGTVRLFGGNATSDVGATSAAPVVNVVTGRVDCATPDQRKGVRNVWIELESNAASFNLEVQSDSGSASTTSQAIPGQVGGSVLGTTPVDETVLGPPGGLEYQSVPSRVNPSLQGKNFQFSINESSATSAYSLLALTVDHYEEPYNR